MVDSTLACASYLSKYISHRVFSDVFVPHSMPVALGTHDNDLPKVSFTVRNVRVPFEYRFPHDGSDRFLTRRIPSGSIVARLQTLRPATAARAWFLQRILDLTVATTRSLISRQTR